MTRRVVYGVGLVLTLACTAMTIASIAMPRWLSFRPNDERKISLGLHRRCSSVEGKCDTFPTFRHCAGDKWGFCSIWRSVGFLMDLTVIIQLCALVAIGVVVAGGVQRRAKGWTVVSSLLAIAGMVECAGMALVAYLFDHDDRFFEDWYLDNCFILCTASWAIMVLFSIGIFLSWLYLPEEGDYELVPDATNHNVEIEQDVD